MQQLSDSEGIVESFEGPREACGLFGAFGVPDAASVIYRGLFALQHRGQESAGLVVSDGERVRSRKGMGLLTEVFPKAEFQDLPGSTGIGHVRYSTTGSSKPQNIQPLIAECADGIWAIAHNGNLVNAQALRRAYQEAGAIFQTSTDSEVLVHLLADPMFRTRPRRVERALSELRGAYSFLLMTRDSVLAARDPYGFRPLSIGRLGDGLVFASETCALDQVGAEFVRDILPGELVTLDARGLRSGTFCEPVSGSLGQCIFEQIYFARPDSVLFGQGVHETRTRLGRRLAEEAPVEADIVIPIPDSGNCAALGFSQASGIPLDYGYIRNHYIGRTFIMPESGRRGEGVEMKLSLVDSVVRGKRVVVVDDSIVRGTTAHRRVVGLREAGAREVHLRISCPPIRHPCHFGVDFPTREELIATTRDAAEIARFVEADSLSYLSIEGLLSCVDRPDTYCTGCFSGRYPMPMEAPPGKLELEGISPLQR
ncbi:MAG: amidophosphoribosyltransferase [Kiritimatiellia bacterium]|nr:amidophosphoribosyltransferase [Kiritimatiellia bacterium]